MESISTDITNHEKYFTLVTSIIFCAERPSGYFEYLDKIISSKNHKWSCCDTVPQHTAKYYPVDIVNYLVAADEKPGEEPQVYSSIRDFEKKEYLNFSPVPQCNLDDSRDDRKLSCNYDHLSTKHQHIPQHYSSLVNTGSRISDDNAVLLIMNDCHYFPESIALSGSASMFFNGGSVDITLNSLLTKIITPQTYTI